MIRVVMLGRLGNNLFQYALGRTLAEKHGVPLLMDASWFNTEGWNQVKCLKLLPGPASGKVKVVRRCSLAARALFKARGKHYWEYRNVPIFRELESDHSFEPRFTEAEPDCMMFGYFQSPLYFSSIEEQLRKELCTHHLGLERGHETLAKKLKQPGSIAVHVRRTDYQGNPEVDLCGWDYYRVAMQKMRDSVANARFFIFSDDPEACRSQFTDADTEVIAHRPTDIPLTNLHLMSLAHHQIIANSSYSWWAAWLGKKDGQKVFMPTRWFATIRTPIEEKRLAHWQTLSPSSL